MNHNEAAESRVLQLRQEIAELEEQLQSISQKAALKKEELRTALLQAELQSLSRKTGLEKDELRTALHQSNEKCQELETEVKELRSRPSDLKGESNKEFNVQGSSSGLYAGWRLASKHQLKSSGQGEPPRKRSQLPGLYLHPSVGMDRWEARLLAKANQVRLLGEMSQAAAFGSGN